MSKRRHNRHAATGIAKSGHAVARLDLTDRTGNGAGGAIRRSFSIETRPEDELTPQYKRNLTVAAARAASINLADMVAVRRALRVHVVGTMGKPFFRAGGDDPWFDKAEKFFSRWGRSADFRTGASWRECLQKLVAALSCEGDVVAVFDDGLLTGGGGCGRFAFFTADQICPLESGDFDAWKRTNGRDGWSQVSGVLYDAFGRRAGVVVTAKHGLASVAADDAFVLVMDPADPDAAPWRHVSRAFRFGQSRTIPDAASALPGMLDSDDIRLYARIMTKRAQSVHGILKHDFGVFEDPRGLDDEIDEGEGDGTDSSSGTAAGDAAAGASPSSFPPDGGSPAVPGAVPDFKALSNVLRENVVGGVDVIDKNDEFTVTPQVSPNLNVPAYLEEELRHQSRAFGLPALLATLHADHSYSGARAEIALAWEHFKDFQQFLEDAFSDWAAFQVFRWAMRTGRLDAAAPEDWEASLAWQYPRIPFLDPQKEATSAVALYRAGLATMEDLGIRPREVFAAMARDKALADSLGVVNCSLFEAAPGTATTLGGDEDGDNRNPTPKDEK